MDKNWQLEKILVIAIAVILFSCSKSQPIKNNIISKDDLPTLSVENVVRDITENGKLKMKVQAPLAQEFGEGIVEPYIDFPKGISILRFKDDKIETSLRANRVIYYEQKRTWEAMGDVVISNINGEVLQTQKLYGNAIEKKIFTDQLVKITKADGTSLTPKKGFESNEEFTIYQFKDVSGRMAFKDEPAEGTADSTSSIK